MTDPTLRQLAEALCDEIDRTVAERARPRGGQQVSFHGDFAGAPPSTLSRLQWWAKTMREAMKKDGADD